MIRRQLYWVFVIAAAIAFASPASSSAQDRKEKSAEAAIRALIDKFNASWNADNGPELVSEVVSDKAFALARFSYPDKSEAILLNKQGYLEGFKKHLWKANLRKHEHTTRSITVIGPLAYELGTITDVTSAGDEQTADVLNVFAEEETGWKLVFSTSPELFRKGVLGDTGSRTDEKAARAKDLEALRKLAKEYVATFESKDPTPFSRFEELLADDVIAIQHGGDVVEGKKALMEYYRKHTAEMLAAVDDSRLVWQNMNVRLMGSSGATVFGKLLISARERQGGRIMRFEVWETLVLRKEADRWRVLEETSTAAPIADSTKPKGDAKKSG